MTKPHPIIAFDAETLGERPERAVAAGRARRLARGLYTTDLKRQPEQIVREHRWEIVGHFIPDAIVTDRSGGPAVIIDETLFVVSNTRSRPLILPGLRVSPRAGHVALDDDPIWPGGLRKASAARALVENLARSRSSNRPSRTLSDAELADWIAVLAQHHTSAQLNTIRDRARSIAEQFEVDRFKTLDIFIGAALGTSPAPQTGPLLIARASGRDWDVKRVALFEEIATQLTERNLSEMPGHLAVLDPKRVREQPFFEAYFSNFIEGTQFTLDAAVRIVIEGEIPEERPADAHDVMNTYELITRPVEPILARTGEDFIALIASQHERLMRDRPEMRPGQLKQIANRVGSFTFVAPEQVTGTLLRGWERGEQISNPFARALYAMFLVSEVHPFDDGNGRIARLAMNSELSAAGEHRILVPIISRNDYLNGLRRCSRDGDAELLVRVLNELWQWSSAIDFSDLAVARVELDGTNALIDPADAERAGVHLNRT